MRPSNDSKYPYRYVVSREEVWRKRNTVILATRPASTPVRRPPPTDEEQP